MFLALLSWNNSHFYPDRGLYPPLHCHWIFYFVSNQLTVSTFGQFLFDEEVTVTLSSDAEWNGWQWGINSAIDTIYQAVGKSKNEHIYANASNVPMGNSTNNKDQVFKNSSKRHIPILIAAAILILVCVVLSRSVSIELKSGLIFKPPPEFLSKYQQLDPKSPPMSPPPEFLSKYQQVDPKKSPPISRHVRRNFHQHLLSYRLVELDWG
mgnify:FL=1